MVVLVNVSVWRHFVLAHKPDVVQESSQYRFHLQLINSRFFISGATVVGSCRSCTFDFFIMYLTRVRHLGLAVCGFIQLISWR